MQISRVICSATILAALGAGPALAFEIKDLTPETPPAQVFSYGLDQYNSGDKATAAEALDFAAKKGIPGAQWKLASMYADGDGVSRDDMKAFQLFSQLAAQGSDDDATAEQAAPFVSNAYVRLGTYYQEGIPNSKVKPDFSRARQAFTYAASFFGNADAQLSLARLYYNGEGGDRDLVQAAKWANLSADKGNVKARSLAVQVCIELAQDYLDGKGETQSAREAARWARQAADYGSIDGQAMLGHILFEGDETFRQPVDGLMWLQIALARSGGNVQWILDMHEEAHSAATEEQWNAARQRADKWFAGHPGAIPLTASSQSGSADAPSINPLASANIPAAPIPLSSASLGSTSVGGAPTIMAPMVPAVAVPAN